MHGKDLQRPTGKGSVCFTPKYDPHLPSLESPEVFQKSVASTIEYTYPLKMMIPEYASSSNCQWLYPVTFGGGLVEGDKVELSIEVENGCSAMVTTQSSTKVFHCNCGGTTSQALQYTVGREALLAVLPDPIVPYAKAKYKQTQVTHLTADSNLVLLDWMTAGRIARHEAWDFNSYDVSNRVLLGNEVVFRDAYRLADTPILSMKSANGEYQTFGSILILGPTVNKLLESRLSNIGKPKAYGAAYNNDTFLSLSPVSYETEDGQHVTGSYIRVLAKSTREAFKSVEGVLTPLFPVLGGNPFAGKY